MVFLVRQKIWPDPFSSCCFWAQCWTNNFFGSFYFSNVDKPVRSKFFDMFQYLFGLMVWTHLKNSPTCRNPTSPLGITSQNYKAQNYYSIVTNAQAEHVEAQQPNNLADAWAIFLVTLRLQSNAQNGWLTYK